MTGPSNRGPLEARIRELSESKGSAGFTIADVQVGFSVRPQRVHTLLTEQIRAGNLFRGALGHRTVRFFGRQEWAEEYAKRRRKPAGGPVTLSRTKAQWPADAPIHYPVDAHGNPLYRVTISPPPRDLGVIRTGWGCGQTITQGGPIV